MEERDVLWLLGLAEKVGVKLWIDGGWGVDALLGRQSRVHQDIDIVIEKMYNAVFTEELSRQGFAKIPMEYSSPCHSVWRDRAGRVIDLHLIEFDEQGLAHYENDVYPVGSLSGQGRIGGVNVRCVTVEAQLLFHQGYTPDENDAHDMRLLCDTFALPLPPQFAQ